MSVGKYTGMSRFGLQIPHCGSVADKASLLPLSPARYCGEAFSQARIMPSAEERDWSSRSDSFAGGDGRTLPAHPT